MIFQWVGPKKKLLVALWLVIPMLNILLQSASSQEANALSTNKTPSGASQDGEAAVNKEVYKALLAINRTVEREIEEAVRCADLGDFKCARDHFLRAYQITLMPYFLFNMATCSMKLGRFKEAVAEYERYLKEETNVDGNEQMVNDAQKLIESLRKKLVHATFTGAPPGTRIRINGESPSEYWRRDPIVLNPRKNRIEIICDNAEPTTQTFEFEEGAAVTIPVSCPMTKRKVVIKCNQRRSWVYVDGSFEGSCPVVDHLEVGQHLLKIEGVGNRTLKKTFSVKNEDTTEISETLERRWWLISGTITTSLGVVGLGVAGIMTGSWRENYDSADTYFDDAEDAALDIGNTSRLNVDERTTLINDYNVNVGNYDDARDDERKTRIAMITSYAVGGTLTAIGVGMILYDIYLERKGERSNVVSWEVSGVRIHF